MTLRSLDVRLWSRECPATVRLILQLCRDGYYDDTIFHRIVPQLLIQTGAVRRTNQPAPPTSKESTHLLQQYRQAIAADEALARRRYETNVRIRFNHRGQVALAMNVPEDGGDDSSTASGWPPQFFITTEAAEHLDGQHVIFGTLGAGGPTMFNAIRIAQTFTGDDDAAAGVGWEEDAPYIRSVKIVEHPCPEQMIEVSSFPGGLPWKQQQQQQSREDESQNAMPKKKKKRKGKLDVNVLSFGDEVDWGEGGGVATSTKTKSNRKQPQSLSNRHTDDATNDNHITSASHHRAMQSSSPNHQHQLLTGTDNNIESLANSNDRQAEAQTGFLDPSRAETDGAEEFKSVNFIPQKSKNEPCTDLQGNQSARELGEKEDSQLKMLDASSSRMSSKKNNAEERTTVSLVEARRARYTTRRSKDKKQREEDTLARLEAFQSKVRTTVTGSARGAADANDKDDSLAARMARRVDPPPFPNDNSEEAVTYHGQILDEDDEDDGDDPNRWMRTKFKCRRHMDHEAAGDGRDAMKDYKVEDDRGQRQQFTNGNHQHQHKRHKKHTDRHHDHPSTKKKHNDHHHPHKHQPQHRG